MICRECSSLFIVQMESYNVYYALKIPVFNSEFSALVLLFYFVILILHIINPLNTELNSICNLLALLGARHILHVSRIRVNAL